MKKRLGALAVIQLILVAFSQALAGLACSPQAAGVAGVIANQADVVAAVNCLGQQLADLRNGNGTVDRVRAARIDELARQIATLQFALDALYRRLFYLEAKVIDFQHPIHPPPVVTQPR
jgi:hypothetical protein